MKRRSILKLIVCLLLMIAAASGLTYFISIEGRLARQLTCLNTMLLVIILARAAKAALGEIDSWSEESSEPKRRERQRQPIQQEKTSPIAAAGSSEIAKAHAELKKELDPAEKIVQEKPVTREIAVTEAKAVPASKLSDDFEMVGYAELVNPRELIFNNTPVLKVVNSKNTFAVYKGKGGYCLMVSEHWLGSPIQYEAIMNQHFRELFTMPVPSSGNRYILRRCTPAGLVRNEDGTYCLAGKGTIDMDIV